MGAGTCSSRRCSFLDDQDYIKRPWEDYSWMLFQVLPYSSFDMVSLLEAAVYDRNEATRLLAVKWLPAYIADGRSAVILTRVLQDASAPAPGGRRFI
ncbi:MAG TPA: hypothetical protein VMH81_02640 [Bryobacteraceae bacterium]|nr:hypothetical protein [Bryobacteraceae bacterium]